MQDRINSLKKSLQSAPSIKGVRCFVLYGSYIRGEDNFDDLDGVLVVEKVDDSLAEIFSLLKDKFKKLDINIYSTEEVLNGLSFYTREFKLEYLAKGVAVIGENIFIKEYQKISVFQYKRSILIRSIEHVQMVRQKYFFGSLSELEKKKFLIKYFYRISKNILLFLGEENHTTVNELKFKDISERLKLEHYSKEGIDITNLSIKEIFNKFEALEKKLFFLKSKLEEDFPLT